MAQSVILHVEDDPDDAFFVKRAFSNSLPGCVVHRVTDGQEAIDYLQGRGRGAKLGSPLDAQIVLLDLKLPEVDGFEVLEWIRGEGGFNNLQVIVLSGSPVEEDKERARQLGANAYFVKTPGYGDVVAFVAKLLPKPDSNRSPRSKEKG